MRSFFEVDSIIRPFGLQLERWQGWDRGDESQRILFVDVCRAAKAETLVIQATVETGVEGENAEHFVVYDAWRRLLFLGAGELEKEWLGGLIEVEYADTREFLL